MFKLIFFPTNAFSSFQFKHSLFSDQLSWKKCWRCWISSSRKYICQNWWIALYNSYFFRIQCSSNLSSSTLLCDIPDFEVFTSIFNLYSVCFIKNSKLWQEDNIFIKKGHRCVSKWNPHPCSFWIILRESICYRMKINHPNLYLFNFNGLQDISRPMFQNLFSFSQINLE